MKVSSSTLALKHRALTYPSTLAFIDEITKVFRKHQLALQIEGNMQIVPLNHEIEKNLSQATVYIEENQ